MTSLSPLYSHHAYGLMASHLPYHMCILNRRKKNFSSIVNNMTNFYLDALLPVAKVCL